MAEVTALTATAFLPIVWSVSPHVRSTSQTLRPQHGPVQEVDDVLRRRPVLRLSPEFLAYGIDDLL